MNRFLIIHSEKDDEWPRDSYLDYIEMSINPEPGSYIHSSNLDSVIWYKVGDKLYNPCNDILNFKMRKQTQETLNDILSNQYNKDISEFDCIIFCNTFSFIY